MLSLKTQLTRFLPGLSKTVLCALGVFALKAQIGLMSGREVMDRVRGYNSGILLVAVVLTAGSFVALAGIELFALKKAGAISSKSISRGRAAATGFVAHAFSQLLGFAILTGAAVRVRAYGPRQVSAADIATVSGFVTLTATLGLIAGGAASLLLGSALFTFGGRSFHLHWIGWFLSALLLAYITWCTLPGRRGLKVRSWRIQRPTGSTAASQILIATADWILAGSVLFVLMPRGMFTYPHFLPAYFVAQSVAVVSHVPGGIGVFEAMLFALLGVAAGSVAVGASVAAAFLLYRVVYYLLPFATASVVAVISDSRTRRSGRALA